MNISHSSSIDVLFVNAFCEFVLLRVVSFVWGLSLRGGSMSICWFGLGFKVDLVR